MSSDSLTFNKIVENLTKTSNVGYYMIHLDRATERLSLIKDLEEKLNTNLVIFKGADGHKLVSEGHPTTCQKRGAPFTRTPGDIGCTKSHINICLEALDKGYDYVAIFEDDCEFVSNLKSINDNINSFLTLNKEWDLFLLGYKPIGAYEIQSDFIKISRFDLTHACILSRRFMIELVKLYQSYYNNNTTLSIDTTYSDVIENNNLNAFGFKDYYSHFRQKYGIYSYIAEGVRI
jgi:GR25 family glycosyltransferase involved in LPS biosynthesis